MDEVRFHELCLLFPQASDDVLADMAEDIKKYGLNEPIIVYKGQILDGRNRYLACRMAGVEPTFKEYTGDEPLSFVVSKNLMRRHLTPSQRALSGYKAYKMLLAQENIDEKTAKKLISERFEITNKLLDDVDRVEEFAIPEVKDGVYSEDIGVKKAAQLIDDAAVSVGIDLEKKPTWDSLTAIQKARIAQAQSDVLEKTEPQKIYEDLELEKVYSATAFHKVVHEIDSIVASMATLPTLYSEAKDYMGSLEEEKLMVVVGNMMITEATKVLSKLHDEALSYDDILGLAAQMLNIRFKVPDLSDLAQAKRVDELQSQIKDGCETLIKNIRKIKRRLSSQGQRTGEAASMRINGDGQSETE